ncbi:MAG: SusC/RagA family TonB-linked outer membrane protein, partial [Pedobacter sp.]
MFALCQTFAQNLQVSGRVTSSGATSQPLSGVNITVKGTTNGTTTNATGDYIITVPQGGVLVVSFIGMSAVERTITSSGPQDFTLTSSTGTMDELVVVGYGVQKKSVVTGAISKVTASDIDNQPIMRVEQFLQGRASGLTIAAASGQPGSGATLRVRGTTSINNSEPLYVVDGIPVDNGGIDYLNTNDIESIEVLKDAASAAIYGTRAASGVILVTTKRGRAGKTTFSYNGYYGVQRTSRRLDLLNATEYATLRNEASVADGGNIIFADPASLGKGTDWQDVIF